MIAEVIEWLKACALAAFFLVMFFGVIAIASVVSYYTHITLTGVLALAGLLSMSRIVVYIISATEEA